MMVFRLKKRSAQNRFTNFRAGQFKFSGLVSKEQGFEKRLTVIEGNEKQMFLNFVSRMLRWRPEERGTAQELLSDPWLKE